MFNLFGNGLVLPEVGELKPVSPPPIATAPTPPVLVAAASKPIAIELPLLAAARKPRAISLAPPAVLAGPIATLLTPTACEFASAELTLKYLVSAKRHSVPVQK